MTIEIARKHRKMICIDSRSRMSHENRNKYTTTFRKIKNVVGIDLVSAEIPYAVLLQITPNNNTLPFSVTLEGVTTNNTLIIPSGLYSAESLAVVIRTQLTENSLMGSFTIEYDQKLYKMQIWSMTGTLLIGSNEGTSMWGAIGFTKPTNLTANSFAHGDEHVQSGNGDFYVYVGLETYGSMESSEGVDDIFAKVSLDSSNRYTNVSSCGKSYDDNSPLSSLCHLNIWFKRSDGSLYDFHETNNSLTVMITYLS